MEGKSMTKELVVQLFKDYCNPSTLYERGLKRASQYSKNMWEVQDLRYGVIRIRDHCNKTFDILFYPTIEYAKKNNILEYKFVFDLSENEYDELKTIYFNDKKW
jgi:hypothetical protein